MIIRGGLKWPGSLFRIARPVYLFVALLTFLWAYQSGSWGLALPTYLIPFLPWLRDRRDYQWMDRS